MAEDLGRPAATALQTALGRATRSPAIVAALQAAKSANRVTYRSPRPLLPDRFELATLLNQRGLTGCGVEIGVKRGEFSEALLDSWRGTHLISVDPWAAAGSDYVDVANVAQAEHDAFHAETVARLERFETRSTIWRMTGDEAAPRIPHGCLDFVYLDARHDQGSVAEDLATWRPKVRPGGVLAGHDYLDGSFADGEFGVRSAVDAFCAQNGLWVGVTFADPPWPSWYVVTPRA